MGIVGSWVHVSRARLESIVAQPDWTAQQLEAVLKAHGASQQEIVDLVYYGHDEPNPAWNSSLARLTGVNSFSLDKAFSSRVSVLGIVARTLPGAAPLLAWSSGKPIVALEEPWKSTDLVGFEVVAGVEQVRAVLGALAPFRDRAACAAFARQKGGLLPEWLSSKRRALRLWVEDDSYWGAWLRTFEALDAVAASPTDYLGFATA